MSSLAELPKVVGFFSYAREDDDDSNGALSRLRDRIQREVRGQLGIRWDNFSLWQDEAAIEHGTLWEEEIKSAVAASVFFIPIVTPTAVNSHHCKFEFELFLKREAELGRDNLVFPILYIGVPSLEQESEWRRDPVLEIIHARQYLDWQQLRHLDIRSPVVGQRLEQFGRSVCKALRQPWSSPEERRKEEEEAQQRAEHERVRQEAEVRRRKEEEEEEERHKREGPAAG
jgi:hypothetical protein